jgi:ArsR family transcriptional regulator, lead/cadmium/zinc/bismuth-responsive transcriptional repressor
MTSHTHPVDPDAVARAQGRLPETAACEAVTSVLTLIADPTRMRLLFALDAAEELCVGDLALALNVSEDAASYGLRMLRTAGLVHRRRAGRMAYYRLAEGFPEPLRQHCLLRLGELGSRSEDDESASP